jgi:hypothetical protein
METSTLKTVKSFGVRLPFNMPIPVMEVSRDHRRILHKALPETSLMRHDPDTVSSWRGEGDFPASVNLSWAVCHKKFFTQQKSCRSSIIGLFAVDYSWRVGVYAATGLLTMETVKMALLFTPALILGTILGHRTHFDISEKRFKQTVAAVLLVSGIFLLIP